MDPQQPPKTLPWTHGCYVCGQDNPIGLHLRFELDKQQVVGRFLPRDEHGGFQGIVHGGLLMAVLDEVMFWAPSIAARRMYWSVALDVRFEAPARVGVALRALGKVERLRSKLAETSGTITDADGRLIACATGKYLPVPAELQEQALTDFCSHSSSDWAIDMFCRNNRDTKE